MEQNYRVNINWGVTILVLKTTSESISILRFFTHAGLNWRFVQLRQKGFVGIISDYFLFCALEWTAFSIFYCNSINFNSIFKVSRGIKT